MDQSLSLKKKLKKIIQGLREVKGLKKEEEEKKGTPVISESARERNIVIYKSDHQSSS